MKHFYKAVLVKKVLLFGLLMGTLFSCEKDEPINLKEMLMQGEWRIAVLKLVPGVRMDDSATAPVIQDFLSYYKSIGIELSKYRFKADGTFEETESNGEIYKGTWSISQDGKEFILDIDGYVDHYRVDSFELGVLNVSLDRTDIRDSYLKKVVPQTVHVVFKQFL